MAGPARCRRRSRCRAAGRGAGAGWATHKTLDTVRGRSSAGRGGLSYLRAYRQLRLTLRTARMPRRAVYSGSCGEPHRAVESGRAGRRSSRTDELDHPSESKTPRKRLPIHLWRETTRFSATSDLEIAPHANRSCDTSRPGLACPGSVPVAPAARVFQRYAARLGRSVAGSIFTEASNPYRRHSRTRRLSSAASIFWAVYLSGEPGLRRAARPGPGSRPSGASPNGDSVRQRCEPVLPFQRWPMR